MQLLLFISSLYLSVIVTGYFMNESQTLITCLCHRLGISAQSGFAPKGVLEMSGDILGGMETYWGWRLTGIQWIEVKAAAKYPPQGQPLEQKLIWSIILSTVLRSRNPLLTQKQNETWLPLFPLSVTAYRQTSFKEFLFYLLISGCAGCLLPCEHFSSFSEQGLLSSCSSWAFLVAEHGL